MANYDFAAVAGTTFAFDAGQDTLTFTAGSAAQLRFVTLGAHVRVFLGTQWVTLHGTSYADLDDANLVFADGSAFRVGGAGNDTLAGTAQGDWLDGRGGADSLVGGDGNDTYRIDDAGDEVVEAIGNGIDTVQSLLAATTLGANVENLWLLSAGSANGTGNGLANTLFAGGGDNVLDGGAGRDTVSYVHAVAGVNVWLGPGAHATGGSGSDTLLSIENAVGSLHADTLNGNGGANFLNGLAGADSLYGAAGADTLFGGAGDDTLWGGAGADQLVGGAGNDIYHVDDAGDVVVETDPSGIDRVDTSVSLTLGANIEQGRVLGYAQVTLTGNELDNTIFGGLGNATLNGGGGQDTISYALMPTGALHIGITVNLSLQRAEAGYDGRYLQELNGFIHVFGSDASDILIGDYQDNRIEGWLGGDFLYGYGGLDTLVGGAGDDYYQLGTGDATDLLVETADGGTQDYLSLFFDDDYVLPDYIEFVRNGSNAGIELTCNDSDNHVYDGGGNDTYDGRGGIDTLSFVFAPVFPDGVVASLVTGVATHEGGTVDTFTGFENLAGGGSDDHLTGDDNVNGLGGGAGDDTLVGGGGDDWMDGSAGSDELTGGTGADRFVFTYAEDTQPTMFDTITDFDPDSGDVIDISLIMSGNGIGAQDPYLFIGSAAFGADATGQLRYENGVLYGSSDADANAEWMIALTGAPAITAADFIL